MNYKIFFTILLTLTIPFTIPFIGVYLTNNYTPAPFIQPNCGYGTYSHELKECICDHNFKTVPNLNNTYCTYAIFTVYNIDNCFEHYLDIYGYCVSPFCPNNIDQCTFDKLTKKCECYHLN